MGDNTAGALPADRATAAEPVVSALRDGIPSAWPFRLRVKAGRAVSDPEKLVVPGILYAARRGDGLTVRLVAFGWWDWHVSFLFAFRHISAQGIEARRAETLAAPSPDESPVGSADAPDNTDGETNDA